MKKNCRTCAHSAGWWLTPTGRVKKGQAAECTALVEIPVLPIVVTVQVSRIFVHEDMGADCPTWKERT